MSRWKHLRYLGAVLLRTLFYILGLGGVGVAVVILHRYLTGYHG